MYVIFSLKRARGGHTNLHAVGGSYTCPLPLYVTQNCESMASTLDDIFFCVVQGHDCQDGSDTSSVSHEMTVTLCVESENVESARDLWDSSTRTKRSRSGGDGPEII